MLYSQTRNDILRIFLLAKMAEADFALTAVPQDFPIAPTNANFDPATMQKLFDVGYMLGKWGDRGWKKNSPAEDETEQSLPRTGTNFAAPITPSLPPR